MITNAGRSNEGFVKITSIVPRYAYSKQVV